MAQASDLDLAYEAQRKQLTQATVAQVRQLLAQGLGQRKDTTQALVNLVGAAQAEMTAMVDAYMAARTGAPTQALDPAKYTTDQLRGIPAWQVYGRPWGAFYAHVEELTNGPQGR